jgi:uridine kinase
VTVESFRALASWLLGEAPRLGGTRLVAVDGPSGAGKTVFAERLAEAIGNESVDVPVVHTDDLLDGWADQVSFWPRLEEWVLAPLRGGQAGRYRRYDWHAGTFGQEWTVVPPAPVVLLEGVTAARAAIRPELTLSVFLTAPARLCLERAVARDGEAVRARLDEWQRGEQRHFAADATAEHADLIVDAASSVPHDEAGQFVLVCRRSGPGIDVVSQVRHDRVHGASPGGGC